MNTPVVRVVVTDSNVLINLMHVSRLGLLAKIPQHEFVVPDHVREEITRPDERALLGAAISDGSVKLRMLGTVEIFVLAIRAGLLTVADADADKLALESHRFKVPFASYKDLVK